MCKQPLQEVQEVNEICNCRHDATFPAPPTRFAAAGRPYLAQSLVMSSDTHPTRHIGPGSRQGPACSVLENLKPARSGTSDNTRPAPARPARLVGGNCLEEGPQYAQTACAALPLLRGSTFVARRASAARGVIAQARPATSARPVRLLERKMPGGRTLTRSAQVRRDPAPPRCRRRRSSCLAPRRPRVASACPDFLHTRRHR